MFWLFQDSMLNIYKLFSFRWMCKYRVNAIRTLLNAFINSNRETAPEKVHYREEKKRLPTNNSPEWKIKRTKQRYQITYGQNVRRKQLPMNRMRNQKNKTETLNKILEKC